MTIPTKETREGMREEIKVKIRRLESRSWRGLWTMAIFLAVTIVAWSNPDPYSHLPEGASALLGAPPPTGLISIALIVYIFSAIILILARMATGAEASTGFSHVGYLAGFYIFYALSGAMEENFWAVFTAGITILCLQSYHIWTHSVEQVRHEKEALAELERREKFAALYSPDPQETDS